MAEDKPRLAIDRCSIVALAETHPGPLLNSRGRGRENGRARQLHQVDVSVRKQHKHSTSIHVRRIPIATKR